jgi:hypothetical protein
MLLRLAFAPRAVERLKRSGGTQYDRTLLQEALAVKLALASSREFPRPSASMHSKSRRACASCSTRPRPKQKPATAPAGIPVCPRAWPASESPPGSRAIGQQLPASIG